MNSIRSRLGRKFEFVCQTPESCLLAYSVVSGEYHCRSQERIVFGQSCLKPFEAGCCFTQAEIAPCNGPRWAAARKVGIK